MVGESCPRSQELLQKPWCQGGDAFLKQLDRETPEPSPPNTDALAIPFSCPPELNNKILLLKTSGTLDIRYTQIQQELSRESPLCQAASIVLGGTMRKATGGEKASGFLSSHNSYNLLGQPAKRDVPTCAQWHHCCNRVTSCPLVGLRPTPQEKIQVIL